MIGLLGQRGGGFLTQWRRDAEEGKRKTGFWVDGPR